MGTQAMSFEAFKTSVIALSRRNKVSHLVPNANTLFVLWEQKLTPQDVITLHCTKEAQKARHNAS